MQYIQSLHQNHICLDMKQSSLIENWLQNLSIFDLDSANGSNLEGKHFRLGDKILNFVFPAVMAFEFQITMYFCHDVVTSATKKLNFPLGILLVKKERDRLAGGLKVTKKVPQRLSFILYRIPSPFLCFFSSPRKKMFQNLLFFSS